MAGRTPDRRVQWTDRSAITVAMAAVGLEPLSSTEPGRPSPAIALSWSSQVRTPKPIGVHVRARDLGRPSGRPRASVVEVRGAATDHDAKRRDQGVRNRPAKVAQATGSWKSTRVREPR